MNNLLTAIVDDDRNAVEALLKADGGLAARLIRKPQFYDSKKELGRCGHFDATLKPR